MTSAQSVHGIAVPPESRHCRVLMNSCPTRRLICFSSSPPSGNRLRLPSAGAPRQSFNTVAFWGASSCSPVGAENPHPFRSWLPHPLTSPARRYNPRDKERNIEPRKLEENRGSGRKSIETITFFRRPICHDSLDLRYFIIVHIIRFSPPAAFSVEVAIGEVSTVGDRFSPAAEKP